MGLHCRLACFLAGRTVRYRPGERTGVVVPYLGRGRGVVVPYLGRGRRAALPAPTLVWLRTEVQKRDEGSLGPVAETVQRKGHVLEREAEVVRGKIGAVAAVKECRADPVLPDRRRPSRVGS